MNSRDAKSVAIALGMLETQLPLDSYQSQALDRRLRELIDGGAASRSPEMARAVTHFLNAMARVRASAVSPFIPALLSFLEMDLATTGAYSYYTLMIIADETPDRLIPFAGVLAGKLDSQSYAVRTLAARIIGRLAGKCPAIMSVTRHSLWNIYRNSDEGPLKVEAGKALEVLFSRGRPGTVGADSLRKAVAMDAHRVQSVVSRLFFSIVARFLNFWRLLLRRGSESSEMARIAEDLQEVARWVEARFPPPASAFIAVRKKIFSDRSPVPFPKRLEFCDVLLPARTKAPATRPSGGHFVEPLPADAGRAGGPELKEPRRTITSRPVNRDRPEPGASVRAGMHKQVLLSEIQRNIDDSLRMASGQRTSFAEIYMKPAPEKKAISVASPSRAGRYVKKRTPVSGKNAAS